MKTPVFWVKAGAPAIVAFYGAMFVLTFVIQLMNHGGNNSGDPNPYWHGNDFHIFWTKFLPDVARWSLAPTVFFAAVVITIVAAGSASYYLDGATKE
jgi:hypothetical protein